jgi:hypothetical protein
LKLTETHFVRGRPVGLIVTESRTGAVDYIPKDKRDQPVGGPWGSVDDLKAALRALYGSGIQSHGSG